VFRVTEHDDAVQVPLLRIRGPLEARERGEVARPIGRIGRLHDLGPNGAGERRVGEHRVDLARAHVTQDACERLHAHHRVGRVDALGQLGLAERAIGVAHLVEHAHELGVLGHHVEVERRLDLDLAAEAAVGDLLALGPGVRVGRRRAAAVRERVE